MKSALLLSLLLAACGGDDGTTNPDAAGSGSGSNSNKVVTVSCTGATKAATVMTEDLVMHYEYSTDTTGATPPTIAVGGIVEFKTSANHDVNPSTTGGHTSDPGVKVGFSQDVCLKFTATGNYDFFCSVHTFFGRVTVQ